MTRILVLYYSRHGATQRLAQAIATGVEQANAEAMLRTVPAVRADCESVSSPVPHNGPPYVDLADLSSADGLVLGSPTRFGNMAAAMKFFLDSTSKEWISGTLVGKPASVFTTTSSMHGGQESTLLSMMLPLLHHGMVLCGLPYSEPSLHTTVSGGTPYGVTHVSGNDKKDLTEDEKRLAFAQGKRIAQLASRLAGNE